MSGPEDKTGSNNPDIHMPDQREQGFSPDQLVEMHRIHGGQLPQGGTSPVPETFSQDLNAHAEE